jgi:hypothetical protein
VSFLLCFNLWSIIFNNAESVAANRSWRFSILSTFTILGVGESVHIISQLRLYQDFFYGGVRRGVQIISRLPELNQKPQGTFLAFSAGKRVETSDESKLN